MDAIIDVSLTYYFLPRFCINYSSPRNMHLLKKQKGSVVWLSVCECVGGCAYQHARGVCHHVSSEDLGCGSSGAFCLLFDTGSLAG